MGYLMGYDLGSSSVKASLLEIETGRVIASATAPQAEMAINAPRPGWAEQDPALWWDNLKRATAGIAESSGFDLRDVQAIGIAYQMHGLVIVDKSLRVLRPSIIWCDSRAVAIGDRAFVGLGGEKCLRHLLNSPGNFTASKLRWVKENEPDVFARVYKAMLPGEYIALQMTGRIITTPSGLSEGILWDFQNQSPARLLLEHYQLPEELLPELAPVFALHGELTEAAAAELGMKPGTKVSYRAGDQPNNAFSLNVLEPGQIAATAGTSGVVYGVSDQANYDPLSRVNTFVHVNHTADDPRYGILLCVNGTAILYRWLRQIIGAPDELSYRQMDEIAAHSPAGARGLVILPYGNGAERTLENQDIGASIHGLDLNRHDRSDLLRAAQEGIVYALNYGIEIMKTMGLTLKSIKAGNANMFLSPVFADALAAVAGVRIELYNTDGSQGAARGAGMGAGIYRTYSEAFSGLRMIRAVEPNPALEPAYREAYQNWLRVMERQLKAL